MKLDITWEELAPFLKSDRKQSDLSLIGHRGRFKQLKAWFAGKEFDRRNFTQFVYQVQEGQILKPDGTKYSESYINNCIKLVKHLARYLNMREEFADFSYFDEYKGQPEDILTPQQINKLADVRIKYRYFRKETQARHRTLIHFLGNVGSRIDETLRLEWRDLMPDQDTHNPMIHFRKEIVKGGKRERWCPVSKWLYKEIMSLPKDGQFVFTRMDASNFRKDLNERVRIAKIPFAVTPHTFRDSSINNKLEFGVPFEEVASYHGHVKIDTTYRSYVRIQAKKLAQSLRQFDPSFVDDQTYQSCAAAAKDCIEKVINNKVCNFTTHVSINENNKKILRFELVER